MFPASLVDLETYFAAEALIKGKLARASHSESTGLGVFFSQQFHHLTILETEFYCLFL